MGKKGFMEEKVFEEPELDELIKKIWTRGAVTQEDVRKVCSGEPEPTLQQHRRVPNPNA